MGLIESLTQRLVEAPVPLRRGDLEAEVAALLRTESPLSSKRVAVVVTDHVLGLGPLEELLRDPEVTDVLVNGPGEIWIEKRGTLQRTAGGFTGEQEMLASLERVLAPLGLRIDRASPHVDARLPDGSRLHAVIPPASPDHPLIAIRRFTQAVSSVDTLVYTGAASGAQVSYLREAVAARNTIIVSGGTGSGKTTLLNLLGALISPEERVVTIEDSAELSLPGHVVRLEAHPPNGEGLGEVTMRQLVRSALRLRPDRLIVGEVRGAEALDLIWALNTGHRGSMSTVHANSPEEALWRLETLALSAGATSAEAVHRQLHSSVDLIVQMERLGGRRQLAGIARVDLKGARMVDT